MKAVVSSGLINVLMFMTMSAALAETQVKKESRDVSSMKHSQIAQFDINPFIDQQRATLKQSKPHTNTIENRTWTNEESPNVLNPESTTTR